MAEPTPTPSFPFPVLDLTDLDKDEASATAFRSSLLKATHEVGFFYLVGTGITPTLEERMLSAAKEFFSLPLEEKLEIENIKSPGFRGYTRLGGERTANTPDQRELLDIWPERTALPESQLSQLPPYHRLIGPNLWPKSLPHLKPLVEEWGCLVTAAARKLLRAWAISLSAEEDYFDRHFTDPTSRLKFVRYPKGEGQGVGPHKDGGCVTFLWVEPGVGGLQIESGDRWVDAPPAPECGFVCNIGEMIELATRGYLKATRHRVVAGGERISIPMFINPDLGAVFERLEVGNGNGNGNGNGEVGEEGDPIFEVYGDNLLKSRLRAHPDVAELYWSDVVGKL